MFFSFSSTFSLSCLYFSLRFSNAERSSSPTSSWLQTLGFDRAEPCKVCPISVCRLLCWRLRHFFKWDPFRTTIIVFVIVITNSSQDFLITSQIVDAKNVTITDVYHLSLLLLLLSDQCYHRFFFFFSSAFFFSGRVLRTHKNEYRSRRWMTWASAARRASRR